MELATAQLPVDPTAGADVFAKPKRKAAMPARVLVGIERAALILLALGEEHGRPIWERLHDDEIFELSQAMANLGVVPPDAVEEVFVDFIMKLGGASSLNGDMDATERLLRRFMSPERAAAILDEIRGPAGRTMWEKLSNVPETVLANYLKNEYPQTIAVVLSKLMPAQAAQVLAILPEDLALVVVQRMLTMDAVQREVLDNLEITLRNELMTSLGQTRKRDPHEQLADIFNNFDRQTEGRFLNKLEEENEESAERIKTLMFTFDDLAKLDQNSAQTLLRAVERDVLAKSLKGAAEEVRDFFFTNMSKRAGEMLRDDMEVMGPLRLKEVDEAQAAMVNLAKAMAGRGEIMIVKNQAEDELVY